MNERELRLAMGQLVAKVLKGVDARGRDRLPLPSVHNVAAVDAFHFHPAIDALFHPGDGGSVAVRTAVAASMMSAIAKSLEEMDAPVRAAGRRLRRAGRGGAPRVRGPVRPGSQGGGKRFTAALKEWAERFDASGSAMIPEVS